MKIVVITGSPRKRGTSALLTERFIQGAAEAGHKVFRFDAAFETVAPCTGCDQCRNGRDGALCVKKDAMETLRPKILEADAVVLVTPLYFFGFSAQIKTVIDRWCGFRYQFSGTKKCILMATAFDSKDWTMKSLVTHFEPLVQYMGWENAGEILAVGCGDRPDIENSPYPQLAYQLGKALN